MPRRYPRSRIIKATAKTLEGARKALEAEKQRWIREHNERVGDNYQFDPKSETESIKLDRGIVKRVTCKVRVRFAYKGNKPKKSK